jgi:hypothetical protein
MADDRSSGSSTYTESVGYMLTTVDNPFNPFTEFKEWHSYDTLLGYHSAALLARIAATSDELSNADQHAAIQAAIDEIVRENVSGMHRKVSESDFETKRQEE